MSSWNSSSFSTPQKREKKQLARHEVRSPNKNHHHVWLVCETRAKILLSHPETSLTTPSLLPLRRSRRSYGNYQSFQPSGSSRNFLKRLGQKSKNAVMSVASLRQITCLAPLKEEIETMNATNSCQLNEHCIKYVFSPFTFSIQIVVGWFHPNFFYKMPLVYQFDSRVHNFKSVAEYV